MQRLSRKGVMEAAVVHGGKKKETAPTRQGRFFVDSLRRAGYFLPASRDSTIASAVIQ